MRRPAHTLPPRRCEVAEPSKSWASWDRDTLTLTVSRPPELSHEQLEAIWSPYVHHGLNEETISAINRKIQHEVQTAQLRAEELTREQRRRQEEEAQRRRDEAARIEQERRQAAQEAKDRAEALLLRSLSDKQKADLQEKNYFLVEAGGETYKIKRGFSGNVKKLDKDGKEIQSFCIHPTENIPDADAMLAQKLLLETDHERFLRTANATNLVPSNDNRRAA